MNKKGWLAVLLALCCFLAGILHIQINPQQKKHLKSSSQIDSLIKQTTYDFNIPADHYTVNTIRMDSLFTRKVYYFQVSPGFSKTTFHQHLQYRLYPLDVEIFGTVEFPERNLRLQLSYKHTVHRTIHIHTDTDLVNRNPVIPRLPK